MLSETKLSTKIALLVFFNLAFTAVLATVAVVQMNAIGNEIYDVSDADIPLLIALSKFTESSMEQAHYLERIFRFSDLSVNDSEEHRKEKLDEASKSYEDLMRFNSKSLEETEQFIIGMSENAVLESTRKELAKVQQEIRQIKQDYAEINNDAAKIIALTTAKKFQQAQELVDKFEQKEDQLKKRVTDLLHEVEEFTDEAAHQAEQDEITALYLIAIVSLVSLIVGVILGIVFVRTISSSLVSSSTAAGVAANQLLAAVQEQAATASETSSAVAQTSATVDELQQTAKVAAEKADSVQSGAEESLGKSEEAQEAVHNGIDAMRSIRDEVEQIAKSILELSEKSIQIGDVITTVSEIAEQSNLLAVNASIEAAKAGEHGKGFAVVANEVKSMAQQSKQATEKVRRLLTDIQKSSNAAVMITEQGVKRVEEGESIVNNLGQAIELLAAVIEDSADASRQIQMTSNQQLAGISQINSAIENIGQATRDNTASSQQIEAAAANVAEIASTVQAIVNGK